MVGVLVGVIVLVEDEVVKSGGTFAVRLTPKRTGSYYLLVEIEKSSEERTPWALIYAFRPVSR